MKKLKTISNPRYDLVFLGIDSGVSQGDNVLIQYLDNLGINTLSTITFIDYDHIGSYIPYKCIEGDAKMFRAEYEAIKYKSIYPKLLIEYNKEHFTTIDAKFISERIPRSSVYNPRDTDRNVIIVTSSNTHEDTYSSVRDLVVSSDENAHPFNTLTHIHLETGNSIEGGKIFMARSSKEEIEIDYPESFEFMNNDYTNNIRMFPQAVLAGGVLSAALVHLISDNLALDTIYNFNGAMKYVGCASPVPTNIDIQLQGDSKVDLLFIGVGGTGGISVSYITHILSLYAHRINSVHIIDGDVIEKKNARNQRSHISEANSFKVEMLIERIKLSYPDVDVKAHARYLFEFNSDVLKEILGTDSLTGRTVVIAECVDKDESRKVVDAGFQEINDTDNIILLSSGNGTDVKAGQLVIGFKQKDKIILEPLAGTSLGSDIRTNTGDITKLFGTCAVATNEHPQHIITNTFAAIELVLNLIDIIVYGKVTSHTNMFNLYPMFLVAR